MLIGHQELHQRMQQALIEAGPGPVEQFAALIGAQVLVHTDYPLLALVANEELHALSVERAAPALALREQSRKMALRVLDPGIRSGVFAVADVGLTAIAIGGMGIRVANWFGPDQPYTREQVADAFTGFALQLAGAQHPANAQKG
ncbi:MAG TPA: hypothetical protein VGP26_20125 [Actinophytocola sp.]|nr:hypothetical protein [Actinophytocola sp.]